MSTTEVQPDPATEVIEIEEYEETPTYSLWARLGAEFFGAFILVLLGVGAALFATFNSVGGTGLAIPLAFGIAVLAGIAAVGHISGGHFNPAVSLGAAVAGRISWVDMAFYWVAQVAGGVLAAALLFVLIPSGLPAVLGQTTTQEFFSGTANGYGDHSPTGTLLATNGLDITDATFGVWTALLVEAVLTAVFVGVILAVTDKRAKSVNPAVAIGLTLAALIMVAAPITNAALNPARATATALFADSWALGQLWLFWVAPLLGGALAGVAYLLATIGSEPAAGWEGAEEDAEAEADDEAFLDEFDNNDIEVDDGDAIDAILGARAEQDAIDVEVVASDEESADVDDASEDDEGSATKS